MEFTSADKHESACSGFNYAPHTHKHTLTVSNNLSEPQSRRNQLECEIENKQSFQIAAFLRHRRLALCLKPQIVLRLDSDIQYGSCSLNPDLIDNSYIITQSKMQRPVFQILRGR